MFHAIRTLIIDDDKLFVGELKERLQLFSRIQIIAEANSACDGIQLTKEKTPDLIFLNAEMPGKSGFDIVRSVRRQATYFPFVIFMTKYPEFALRALRTGAIDYLCKPLNTIELQNAVERAFEEVKRSNQMYKIDRLLDYVAKYKQLFFPSPTGFKSVNIQDIVFIQKNQETGRVDVITGDNNDLTLPVNYSLTELMKILPRIDFFQIKREVIINLRCLLEVEIQSRTCILKKEEFQVKLNMSRRSLKEFKERLVI